MNSLRTLKPAVLMARTLLVKFLTFFFRVVRLPASFDPIVADPAKHVLITQSDSLIVEGLLLSLARRAGLAAIDKLQPGRRSNQPPGLRWMSIHDQQALRFLSSAPGTIYFCTLNIFKLRGPLHHSPNYRMGFFSLTSLLLARRLLYVLIGTPVQVPLTSSVRLLRLVKLDFYKNLKLVRGTPLQSLETQRKIILSGQEFEKELRAIAERSGEPLASIRRQACASFYEMAANPRRPMYSMVFPVARFLLRRLFSEIITSGVENLIPAAKDHTVILVPMHRSHLDYILVGYKLFEANLNPPLAAAGMNLRFWPIGFVLRSLGGYFVKRKARDRLHSLVLKRYVTYLVKRGHMQEFFIEGGRSRSGKMLQPKYGLLSILLETWLKGLRKDLLFVPVAITYENLIEDTAFADENSGGSKKKENLLSLLRAFDIFQKKYGEVIISFGQPLSVSKFWAAHAPQAGARSQRRARLDERLMLKNLGLAITHAIRDQINPSLTGLTYTALLMSPYYGLPSRQLLRTLKTLVAIIEVLRRAGYQAGQFTPALQGFLSGRESIVRDITRGAVVHRETGLDDEIYFIPADKRITADFYRNSLLHLFFPYALLCTLLLINQDISAAQAGEQHQIFAYDLLLSERPQFQAGYQNLLQTLSDDQLLQKMPEGGYSPAPAMQPLMIPGLLLSTIQTHLWVHHNLKHNTLARLPYGENKFHALRVFSRAQFMASLQNSFEGAFALGLVTRHEALSHTALVSVLESLEERQVLTLADVDRPGARILVKQECDQERQWLQQASHAILAWQHAASARNQGALPGPSPG